MAKEDGTITPLGPIGEAWTETTQGEDKDSIEVSRNATGGYSYSVKVYGEDHEAMLAKVIAIEAKLAERYPAAWKQSNFVKGIIGRKE